MGGNLFSLGKCIHEIPGLRTSKGKAKKKKNLFAGKICSRLIYQTKC